MVLCCCGALKCCVYWLKGKVFFTVLPLSLSLLPSSFILWLLLLCGCQCQFMAGSLSLSLALPTRSTALVALKSKMRRWLGNTVHIYTFVQTDREIVAAGGGDISWPSEFQASCCYILLLLLLLYFPFWLDSRLACPSAESCCPHAYSIIIRRVSCRHAGPLMRDAVKRRQRQSRHSCTVHFAGAQSF